MTHGQTEMTSTATALGSSATVTNRLLVTAPLSNQGPVLIGNTGVTLNTGSFIEPGMAIEFAPDQFANVADAFVISATDGVVSWMVS